MRIKDISVFSEHMNISARKCKNDLYKNGPFSVSLRSKRKGKGKGEKKGGKGGGGGGGGGGRERLQPKPA